MIREIRMDSLSTIFFFEFSRQVIHRFENARLITKPDFEFDPKNQLSKPDHLDQEKIANSYIFSAGILKAMDANYGDTKW